MTSAVEAIHRYQAQYRRFAGNGAAGSPPWLVELRERAIDRFAQTGFPSTRDEAWRFTSVETIVDTPFDFAESAGARVAADDMQGILVGAGRFSLVFVDGRYEPSLSRTNGAPGGLRVESLRAALSKTPDLVRQHLARYAGYEAGGFAALSTAFIHDGAFVYFPPNLEFSEPLQLVFVSAAADRRVFHPRCLVVVDRESRGVVQEVYVGSTNGTHFTNAVTELVVGDGARLEHCRVQRESHLAYHVATTQSRQGRDSQLDSCTVTVGAGLSRQEIGAVLDGPGALLNLNGLSVLGGRQHVDYHTMIDHAKPNGESHEFFNGIFDDHARGVFNGRIVVRPGAQRTDSKQTNNNLLLSADARADSQPQLEIYADDVKCTHGATLGPLDEASMFYLRSRGLDAAAARGLLTYGFGADIVRRVASAPMREDLDRLLVERLGGRPPGGGAA